MKDKSAQIPIRVTPVEEGNGLSRRRFLTLGSVMALGVGAFATTALTVPAGRARARDFTVLGAEVGGTLLILARDIFPHDHIEDRYYLQALAPLETQAATDDQLKGLLVDGVAALDHLARQRFEQDYAELEKESDRVGLLYVIEHGAFFQKVKGHLVTGFYDNKQVWPLFGYEGSSWEKGGYVNRGFDDIDWLGSDA
ncbi:gluconate 2-dehydrogenase subunit 3 family protein [Zobellella maritima]|uniref:gluconate 2-dehydrogenase subunit 3 family protein n=1 Tax=Zobellella maritima TaxID=2059725 RepID=UPI000E30503D|nr:gluconate 2-dehydrogenase subunit 3 family protein [Zobellella maritima]